MAVLSFFQSWWVTWTTLAALMLNSFTRSAIASDPKWPSRYISSYHERHDKVIILSCDKKCHSNILQTQQHKFVSWQGDAEFRGKDFTATVTFGNPDVLIGSGRSPTLILFFFIVHVDSFYNFICLSGIVITHYLQALTPALALGGELVYHRRPSEEGAVMSLVGRYTGELVVTPLCRVALFFIWVIVAEPLKKKIFHFLCLFLFKWTKIFFQF